MATTKDVAEWMAKQLETEKRLSQSRVVSSDQE
jgi:hypothetical protein